MKKKFLSSLLFAALVGGAVSTFTACKDYDDDINNLQKQIDANADAIKKIEDLIKAGNVITSVDKITNGVRVTLSDDSYFDVTNGNDGKDGTAWTIGDDGYWYKDGEKTDFLARGPQGEPGADGTNGTNGADGTNGTNGTNGVDGADGKTIYYKPNADGYFDKCELTKDGEKVLEKNAISYLGEGGVTAAMDSEYLTIFGIKNGDKTESVQISLTTDLRSLVFMPKIYLDGIETVKYPWIQTTSDLKKVTDIPGTNHQGKTVKALEDYQHIATAVVCNYGPAWPVDYHMNPSNSNVKSEDVVGFNGLQSEVIYTRAAQSNVAYAEKDITGKTLFNNANGVLTVGMQVENPEALVSQPTKDSYQKDQVIALQVKSKASLATEGVITSDYALIRPMKTTVEGLVWVEKPMYGVMDPAKRTQTGDQNCGFEPAIGATKVHVWDNPNDAIADGRGAALELYYDSEEGIDISKYLGIHYSQESVDPNVTLLNNGVWNFGQEKAYGLSYEFNLIYYTVDGNKTVDSRYGKWVDQAKGQLRAWNVKYDGDQYPDEGATSGSTVDREPLVQVLVKDHCGNVILDGYILVHITREAPVEQVDNKIITKWDANKDVTTFDLCNYADARITTWAQFSDYVLTQEMENMSKEDFDKQYAIDVNELVATETAPDGGTVYYLNVYEDAPVNGGNATLTDKMGEVQYVENTLGTTNHTFKWIVGENLLETWTHDAEALPVNKTIYVRYKAIAGQGAKYPYIYIKLSQDFKRKDVATTAFGEKNTNYWYGLDGNDEGLEAIVLDVNEPRDGMNISTIRHEINSTLVKNAPKTAGYYYFVPEAYQITAQNGITYTVSPKSSDADVTYNQLYCKYVTYPVADKHEYNRATLNELLNKCAIDYAAGAFKNSALYASYNNKYVKIATLNQATGVITLIKNDQTKDILNAVGYVENHANINTEMRALIGFVTSSQCDVADIVNDNIFTASWQRPINMKKFDNHVAVDAKTNGNNIYILDFLKLFDWRGEATGYMWNDQQWFWAYYGVKAITVDVTPSKVLTNMHSGEFKPLSDITTAAKLYTLNGKKQGPETFTFDLTAMEGDNYDYASMNPALLAFMEANKSMFGGIYYENNGDNVTNFSVRIPVTIEYEWGKITETIEIQIERTAGN